MESFFFDLLHFLYVLSLAAVIGGGLALGSAAAPTLFRELDRRRAGEVFGSILERWDSATIVAAILLVVTSLLKYFNFESGEPRLAVRYAAVALVVVASLYSAAWSNPLARGLRKYTRGFDDLPANAPERVEFARYHARSRRAMTVALLAGLVALYLS